MWLSIGGGIVDHDEEIRQANRPGLSAPMVNDDFGSGEETAGFASALPAELTSDNDSTDVMCTRCGTRMTCTVWEASDLHCLEGDAVKCALLGVEATGSLRDERSLCAVKQLEWALRDQKGLPAAAAAAAALRLAADVPQKSEPC